MQKWSQQAAHFCCRFDEMTLHEELNGWARLDLFHILGGAFVGQEICLVKNNIAVRKALLSFRVLSWFYIKELILTQELLYQNIPILPRLSLLKLFLNCFVLWLKNNDIESLSNILYYYMSVYQMAPILHIWISHLRDSHHLLQWKKVIFHPKNDISFIFYSLSCHLDL